VGYLTYGFFVGPILGYIFDFHNRVTVRRHVMPPRRRRRRPYVATQTRPPARAHGSGPARAARAGAAQAGAHTVLPLLNIAWIRLLRRYPKSAARLS
jgi:hypothetical protein